MWGLRLLISQMIEKFKANISVFLDLVKLEESSNAFRSEVSNLITFFLGSSGLQLWNFNPNLKLSSPKILNYIFKSTFSFLFLEMRKNRKTIFKALIFELLKYGRFQSQSLELLNLKFVTSNQTSSFQVLKFYINFQVNLLFFIWEIRENWKTIFSSYICAFGVGTFSKSVFRAYFNLETST